MNEYFSLEGKIAVVTGGGSGIGLATVKRFANAGAKVVIGDLNDCSTLAEELGGRYVRTDVTQEAQVKALMEMAVETFGRLDIVVNNAGVFAKYKALEDTTREDFQFCFDVNTMGVVYGIKHASRLMAKGGCIINTASMAAKRGSVDLMSYVASKYPVVGITETAALELANRNIRVNCICPSTVDTPMAYADGGEDFMALQKVTVPLGRACQAEEAAASIHFLAADDCGFINGQAINLCGGSSAGLHRAAAEKLSN